MNKVRISVLLIITLLFTGCQTNTEPTLYEYFKDNSKDGFIIANNIKITLPLTEEEYLRDLGHDYDTIDIPDENFIVWDEYEKFVITPYEHSHWKFGYIDDNGQRIPVIFKWTDLTAIDTNATRTSTWSEAGIDTLHFYYYFTDSEPFYLEGQVEKTKAKLYFLGEKGKQGEQGYKFDNYLYEGLEIPMLYVYTSKMWN